MDEARGCRSLAGHGGRWRAAARPGMSADRRFQPGASGLPHALQKRASAAARVPQAVQKRACLPCAAATRLPRPRRRSLERASARGRGRARPAAPRHRLERRCGAVLAEVRGATKTLCRDEGGEVGRQLRRLLRGREHRGHPRASSLPNTTDSMRARQTRSVIDSTRTTLLLGVQPARELVAGADARGLPGAQQLDPQQHRTRS